MSEIIKWKELTTYQKNAIVAGHVMKLHVHITKVGTEELLLILDTANRPIGQVQPYTVELCDAWKVLETIADDNDYNVRCRFLCAWQEDGNPNRYDWKQCNPFDAFIDFDNIRNVTPERICIAALRAKGIELDTQETTKP